MFNVHETTKNYTITLHGLFVTIYWMNLQLMHIIVIHLKKLPFKFRVILNNTSIKGVQWKTSQIHCNRPIQIIKFL